jgi:hypothetical protein
MLTEVVSFKNEVGCEKQPRSADEQLGALGTAVATKMSLLISENVLKP